MAKTKQIRPACHCGAALKTRNEQSFKMCEKCLNQIGIATEESEVPLPKETCFSAALSFNVLAFDRLLWLIDWWAITAEQCSPEDTEYVAKRLEELALKMRRSI